MPDQLLVPPVPSAYAIETIVRLGNEGVPVSAIARSTQESADTVRDILRHAVEIGKIVEIPAPDWPPKQERVNRQSTNSKARGLVDDDVVFSCVRVFKVTRLQASLLAVLIKRAQVTKETLHQVIEQRRPVNAAETDPKMVDVVICHLRKRLGNLTPPLTITTIWSCGYFIPPTDRLRAAEMLAGVDKVRK